MIQMVLLSKSAAIHSRKPQLSKHIKNVREISRTQHRLKDQSATPLVDALRRCALRQNAAFYTPGHKRGQRLTAYQHQLFGSKAFRADLPELPELDNLFAPEGVILQAQQLAAAAFGAEQTHFLSNGSTCGIEAAILATCGPGDKIILPRNAHVSAISGLILSGAIPIYISPTYSSTWEIPLQVTPERVREALERHSDAKAVLIVSPTYEGVCSNLSAIAQITHSFNCPLIVDEAHGAHFAFHAELPTSALSAGADITIQSIHKTLSAFTQAAMLHMQGDRIDRNKLSKSLQLTQSTSPSYLLLGSLDAARHQMATEGKTLMDRTLKLADEAAYRLSQLPVLKVLQPHADSGNIEEISGDRTRLTVDVSGLNLIGFAADEILHTQYQVTAELPSLSALTFIISIGNTQADIDRLIHGFKQLCQSYQPPSAAPCESIHQKQSFEFTDDNTSQPTTTVLTPREAFFAKSRSVSAAQSIGCTSAETICPYPPGIPAILPGEKITAEAIAALKSTLQAGGIVTGCNDPTLDSILIVDS